MSLLRSYTSELHVSGGISQGPRNFITGYEFTGAVEGMRSTVKNLERKGFTIYDSQ